MVRIPTNKLRVFLQRQAIPATVDLWLGSSFGEIAAGIYYQLYFRLKPELMDLGYSTEDVVGIEFQSFCPWPSIYSVHLVVFQVILTVSHEDDDEENRP